MGNPYYNSFFCPTELQLPRLFLSKLPHRLIPQYLDLIGIRPMENSAIISLEWRLLSHLFFHSYLKQTMSTSAFRILPLTYIKKVNYEQMV